MAAKGGGQVSGFKYFLTILMGIGRGPIDELFQIVAGGQVAWDGAYDALGYTGTEIYGDDAGTLSLGEHVTRSTENIPIDREDLFGGDQAEGGLVGYFNVYMGDADQPAPAAFYELKGDTGLRPAMRGVTVLMYDGQVCANNPYPKEFKFRARRVLKGWDGDPWYPAKAVIRLTDPTIPTYTVGTDDLYGYSRQKQDYVSSDGTRTTVITDTSGKRTVTTYDPVSGSTVAVIVPLEYNDIYAMNPAHIIYEASTNRDWGRGMDRDLIDNISFTSAANTLYDEGFGLCMKWSRQDDVDSFVQGVLDHIGGVLYTDKTTGLLCLRLLRDDYDTATVPVFDYEHGLLSVETADTAALDATVNEIIVQYNSPVLNADRQARAQNIAHINSVGAVFSQTKHYPGIPTSGLAQIVAQRDLRSLGSGMKRATVKLDRRAYLMVPGDIIVVNAPDKGLPNAVLRVVQMEEAQVQEGTITATCLQDVFAPPLNPFIEQEPSSFKPPNRFPVPVTHEFVIEASYRDIWKFVPEQADALDAYTTFLVAEAAPPTPLSMGFDLWASITRDSVTLNPYQAVREAVPFADRGVLASPIGTRTGTLSVTGIRMDALKKDRALVLWDTARPLSSGSNFEIVVIKSFTRNNAIGGVDIVVGRGCVDTISIPHPAGQSVWNYDVGMSLDSMTAEQSKIVVRDWVMIKPLTKTMAGMLPISQAIPAIMGAPTRWLRKDLPYSGADFQLNGRPREVVQNVSSLTATWKHRDRILQQDVLVSESEGNIGPEAGVTYAILIDPKGSGDPGAGDVWQSDWTSSNSMVLTSFDLATTAGIASGYKTVSLVTQRLEEDGVNQTPSWKRPSVNVYYSSTGAPPPVVTIPPAGWGVNYGNNYGAP